MCFGNISKDVTVDDIKKSGLNGYVNESLVNMSVDYNSIDVDDIIDIHKYVAKKHDIK